MNLKNDASTPEHESAASIRLLSRDSILPGLAVFIVCTVWIPSALAAILLLAGMHSWWLPAGLGSLVSFSALWLLLFRGLPRKESLVLGALVLGALLAAAAISVFCYDTYGDGRWYHADAILALLHGVNPIYSTIPAPDPVWSNHYPKATWYFAALVIHTFRNYQLGKIYNFLLVFACAAYAGDFFLRLGVRGRDCVILAVVTAFGPVAAAQLVSYYVDGALGSLLTLILLAIVNLVFFARPLDRIVFFLSASLAIAVKFTGGPYLAAAVCVLIASRFLFRPRYPSPRPLHRVVLADVTVAMISICVGVLVLGYNPYVTNMREGFNPLYPVLGPNRIDLMADNTPPVLLGRSLNRVQKLTISLFSQTEEHTKGRSTIKIPFMVSRGELISLTSPDVRMAGWGVFFSGVMLASIVLFLLSRGWRGNSPIILLLVLVLATTLINPECWWARYAPQFALLPVLLLVPCLRGRSRLVRSCAQALCAILLVNNLLFTGGTVMRSVRKVRMLDQSLALVVRSSGPGEYWAYRTPGHWAHFDQFSNRLGVVICGQVDPPIHAVTSPGFPLSLWEDGQVEVTLYKGACASGPPF